jgi:hypothetical protein
VVRRYCQSPTTCILAYLVCLIPGSCVFSEHGMLFTLRHEGVPDGLGVRNRPSEAIDDGRQRNIRYNYLR